MIEEILTLVRAMSPSEPPQELTLLLVQAAQQELERALRPGITPQDCRDAFLPAAAFLTLARLQAGSGEQGVRSFTAGDVTIHRDNGSTGTSALLEQARALMAPYIADPSFLFLGVMG